MSRCLVIKRDALGDALLFSSALKMWAQDLPSVAFTLLVTDFNSWIFYKFNSADVSLYPRSRFNGKFLPFKAIRQWWVEVAFSKKYDTLIYADCMPIKVNSAKRIAKFNAKKTIAFSKQDAWNLIETPLTPPVENQIHEIIRLYDLVKPLGCHLSHNRLIPFPQFELNPSMRNEAEKWLSINHLNSDFIIIGTNGSKNAAKPSADQILILAESFWHKHALKTVLLWKPGTTEFGDDLLIEPVLAKHKSYIIPCRDTIACNVGLIKKAKFSFLPDGGLMHVAASCEGVLGFFANDSKNPSPRQWAPYGKKTHFLLHPDSTDQWPLVDLVEYAERAYQMPERLPLNRTQLQEYSDSPGLAYP